MEGELRGLADEILEPLRIAETRSLDEDAVLALALDRRLDGAELIDTARDDLDRLVDDRAHALRQAGLRIGHLHETVRADREVELVDGGAAEQ